jgi:hypothetical protein
VATLLGLSDAAVRKRLSRARSSVREDLLRRFGEFARSSAPGTAFASLITAALGAASKPASAMGLLTASSTVTGAMLGKLLMGTLAAVGTGLAAGLAVLYYCGRQLLGFAQTEAERRAIRRWVHGYAIGCFAGALGILAGAIFSPGWQTVAILTLAMLAVGDYQLLVQLPRLMNPLLDRDAIRHPESASRRRAAYRVTWGSTGVLISNVLLIGSMTLALLSSSRLN